MRTDPRQATANLRGQSTVTTDFTVTNDRFIISHKVQVQAEPYSGGPSLRSYGIAFNHVLGIFTVAMTVNVSVANRYLR